MKRQLLTALNFALILAIFVAPVLAAIDFNKPPTAEDQATFDQILQPVMKIYNLIKYIATAIAGLILLLAGINYIMSGSEAGKREKAKSMAMYVIIGLVIIWAAPLVVKFMVG